VVYEKPHILVSLVFAAMLLMAGLMPAYAQKPRSSVSAAEVTGTFSYKFGSKFKRAASTISILALGKGKLRVAFDLIYPRMVDGELTANMGEGGGTATITGDTAVFESNEFGPCKITIRFTSPGSIDVTQQGSDADCGFGHNVMATGHYVKTSSKRPRFTD